LDCVAQTNIEYVGCGDGTECVGCAGLYTAGEKETVLLDFVSTRTMSEMRSSRDQFETLFAYDYGAMRRAMGPIRGELLAYVMAPSRLCKLAGLGLIG
jgi:hypothetical protein